MKILDDNPAGQGVPRELRCHHGLGLLGSRGRRASPGATWRSSGSVASGLRPVQGARLAGAEMIFAIDPVQLKRDLAPTFGATPRRTPPWRRPSASFTKNLGAVCETRLISSPWGSGRETNRRPIDPQPGCQAGSGRGHQHPSMR